MVGEENSTVSLRDYRNAVAGQVDAGLMLGEVEDFIEACPLDEEQKSVLWLWAWLHQPPDSLHRFAESEVLRLIEAEN
jgi:hypothetical protein